MNPSKSLLVAALLVGAIVAPASASDASWPGASQMATVAAEETLLYDQTTPTGVGGPPSSHYIHEPLMAAYDSQAADDFVVPEGALWTISRLVFDGEYRSLPGPVADIDVALYADRAGQPGAKMSLAMRLKSYVDDAGKLSVTLPIGMTLPAGTYWLSVQANIDYRSNGLWAFTSIDHTVGNPAVWRNPSGGYHLPCPNWQPQAVCFGGAPGDLRFTIYGTKV